MIIYSIDDNRMHWQLRGADRIQHEITHFCDPTFRPLRELFDLTFLVLIKFSDILKLTSVCIWKSVGTKAAATIWRMPIEAFCFPLLRICAVVA